MRHSRTVGLVRAALAAALIAVSALVTVPIGPVPVTLQILAVAVTALLLPPSEAFAALLVYVGLGAIGIPVFAGWSGGVGVLLGPTGGFLLGFVIGAPLGSFVRGRLGSKSRGHELAADIAGVVVMIAVSYVLGLLRFTSVTGMAAAEGIGVAIAPFVIPDAIKAAVAIVVARAVRRAGAGIPAGESGR